MAMSRRGSRWYSTPAPLSMAVTFSKRRPFLGTAKRQWSGLWLVMVALVMFMGGLYGGYGYGGNVMSGSKVKVKVREVNRSE